MKISRISDKITQIKALILDVDGVLTDGGVYINAKGEESKCFHTQDGFGLKRLKQAQITLVIISGRSSPSVTHRMQELGITHVHQGITKKLVAYQAIKQQLTLDDAQIAYMGDDLPDLPLIKIAGLGIAPQNAVSEVKRHADWVTNRAGGNAAVREVCDFMLYSLQTAVL